jgi:hypothetical protein
LLRELGVDLDLQPLRRQQPLDPVDQRGAVLGERDPFAVWLPQVLLLGRGNVHRLPQRPLAEVVAT